MKKFIISLLVFTCVLLNIAPLFNVNVFAHSDEESGTVSYCESASDSINFDSGNSNVFSPGETISFTYTVRSEYDIVDVSGEAIGFDVIRLEANEKKRIYVTLACDSSIEVGSLMISVQLSNGEVLSTSIYGLNNMYGTFISYYEEGALDEYLNYMKIKGYLPESECVRIKKEYTNQKVTNTYRNMSHEEFDSMYGESEIQNTQLVSERTLSTYAGTGDTRIVIGITYRDSTGLSQLIRGAKVEIYDKENVGSDELLATLISNDDGMVSYYTDNNDGLFQNGYDIYVKVYTDDGNVTIVNNVGTIYSYDGSSSTIKDIKDGQTHVVNISLDTNGNNVAQAFAIFQPIFTARDFARVQIGTTPNPITVKYPTTKYTNSCYVFGADVIHIYNPPSYTYPVYDSWDLIMHEYGHHIQYYINLTDPEFNSLEHDSSINHAADLNNKDKGIKLAWREAWPTVFGMIAQKYYFDEGEIPYVADTNYTDPNNNYSIESSTCYLGEACERSIMAVLWDIFDGVGSETIDSISLMYSNWWNVMANSESRTFSEFVNHYYSVYSSVEEKMKLGKLLTYYKMAPDIKEDYSYTGEKIDENNNDENLTTPRIVFNRGVDLSVTVNGVSYSLNNNLIDILFYDQNYNFIMQINAVPNASGYNLSKSEWKSIFDACNNTGSSNYYVCIRGKNTVQNCETGYYYSEFLTLQIP